MSGARSGPPGPGWVVILNGAPRSGKSSIAAAMQTRLDGVWLNLGVDVWQAVTPARLRPGIGLRPGAERPDLEAAVAQLYAHLFDCIAAHSRQGFNVVSDLGLHDGYTRPLDVLADARARLAGLPVLWVGVQCPIEIIMARRNAGQPGREGVYLGGDPQDPPEPVLRWQAAVHDPGVYDLEVDTAVLSPEACADAIGARLATGTL